MLGDYQCGFFFLIFVFFFFFLEFIFIYSFIFIVLFRLNAALQDENNKLRDDIEQLKREKEIDDRVRSMSALAGLDGTGGQTWEQIEIGKLSKEWEDAIAEERKENARLRELLAQRRKPGGDDQTNENEVVQKRLERYVCMCVLRSLNT
ncbi:hypothetical protein FACS189472_16870 [Alphaproteobacteria bacterium]|nr:hypothetical protein FACS189472_16870 [Alphaproteobacteria bacterium]